MTHIRRIAQYYVDFMVKLGLLRFSLFLALVLIVFTTFLMIVVTLFLHGTVAKIDLLRAFLFSILITPCAVYFVSIIVDQLEHSRQDLSQLVDKLELLHLRDSELHEQLQKNIEKLNQEITVRIEAEKTLQQVLGKLEQEIENKKEAQKSLEQKSSLLRSFLDASPDLVFYRDENFAISGCNRAMELLVGKREKQLIGLKPHDIYDDELAQKVLKTDEKVFQHHVSITYEIWTTYPDGRKACFEMRKVPFYDSFGNRKGLMGFGRDITEHKHYQEALEKASRDKTTFISTISHELRTPLNGIVGLSRILLDMQLTKEQENYLKTIHVSAVTLGNIFNDIVEMDHIERHNTHLNIQPVNFTDFLSDLENVAGLLAEPKGFYFKLEHDAVLPTQLLTDETRLRQILWNLIGNGIKFTQKGGIKVKVQYDTKSAALCFDVEDTGIGIPIEEQDKIFAMYYQAKREGHLSQGSGIGLAVSYKLAQAMGGDITVKSEPDVGSCFRLCIAAPEVLPTTESEEEDISPILHILLVEDIALNITVASSVLEKLGHSLDVAMTGKEALKLFTPSDYDLVLLDIQLPDMTGFEVARQIRERYPHESLPPLIALTANVLKDKGEYIDAGLDDALSKPLSVPALIAMIDRFWGIPNDTINDELPTESTLVRPYDAKLDLNMLEQYVDLVGKQIMEKNIDLFLQMMPDYLLALDSAMQTGSKESIVEEGHKIKGAVGSIGLQRLQQLAQKIQTPSTEGWDEYISQWVNELKAIWLQDVDYLKQWLKTLDI